MTCTRAQKRAWKAAVEHARPHQASQASSPSPPLAPAPAPAPAPIPAEDAEASSAPTDRFITPTKKRRTVAIDIAIEPSSKQSLRKRTCRRPEQDAKPESPAAATSAGPARKTSLKRALACSRSLSPEKNTTESAAPLTSRQMLQRLCGQHSADDLTPLVGRESERRQIEAVFGSRPQQSEGGCSDRLVFLIGPPGTGKSSCVDAIARQHQTTVHAVRLNCSTFATATALYAALRMELAVVSTWELPMQLNATEVASFVEATRKTPSPRGRRPRCVIVLDELDQMLRLPIVQRKTIDQLLRLLARCVQLPRSSLRLIGIMNAIHGHTQLDDMLRPDGHRPAFVMFPSYTYADITVILQAYVEAATNNEATESIVEPRALEIIARKIAARDGDARRAIRILQQCARSCVANEAAEPKVTLRQALQTWNATLAPSSSAIKQIEQLPRVSKLVLAVVSRLTPNEGDRTNLQAVQADLQLLQFRTDLPWIPCMQPSELEHQLGTLECLGFIKQGPVKNGRAGRISTTVPMSVVHRAFQSDPLLGELLGPQLPPSEL